MAVDDKRETEYWTKKAESMGLMYSVGYYAWLMDNGVDDGDGFLATIMNQVKMGLSRSGKETKQ